MPELLVVAFLFSIFLLASYSLLKSGMAVWHRTESSQDTSFQLGRVKRALEEDLRPGSFKKCRVGADGDAVWFLSAVDPVSGEFIRRSDGSPYWQRNILYYLARPADHDDLFKVRCDNQSNRCPHQFLVRRVIDTGDPTPNGTRLPLSKIEELMTAAAAETLRETPRGYDLDFSKETESDTLVATGLLSFQVDRSASMPELEIGVSGFSLQEAGKKVRLGREDLTDSSYTRQLLFSIFPGTASQ